MHEHFFATWGYLRAFDSGVFAVKIIIAPQKTDTKISRYEAGSNKSFAGT
jgi:hypothetical protein